MINALKSLGSHSDVLGEKPVLKRFTKPTEESTDLLNPATSLRKRL